MSLQADLGTNSVSSAIGAAPYLCSSEHVEDSFISEVLPVTNISRDDREAWRRFLTRHPAAFLSYPYVCAFASQYPSIHVTRILTPNGRTVAFFPFQYRS